MPVKFRLNTAPLRRLGRAFPAAVARAMNRAGVAARAVGAREVAKDIGLPVNVVRKEIVFDRATSARLIGTLTIRGARIPLIAFQARGPEPSRGKGKGVTYRYGRRRRRLPSAFITTRAGHRGVFRRVGKAREPIIELRGPSLPLVFSRREIARAITARYEETLPKNLQHEVERELLKVARRL